METSTLIAQGLDFLTDGQKLGKWIKDMGFDVVIMSIFSWLAFTQAPKLVASHQEFLKDMSRFLKSLSKKLNGVKKDTKNIHVIFRRMTRRHQLSLSQISNVLNRSADAFAEAIKGHPKHDEILRHLEGIRVISREIMLKQETDDGCSEECP